MILQFGIGIEGNAVNDELSGLYPPYAAKKAGIITSCDVGPYPPVKTPFSYSTGKPVNESTRFELKFGFRAANCFAISIL